MRRTMPPAARLRRPACSVPRSQASRSAALALLGGAPAGLSASAARCAALRASRLKGTPRPLSGLLVKMRRAAGALAYMICSASHFGAPVATLPSARTSRAISVPDQSVLRKLAV